MYGNSYQATLSGYLYTITPWVGGFQVRSTAALMKATAW